jgi:hypothetical protein
MQVPAAIAGAFMSIYTASLLSATSTPLWAAAPKSLAVRFASSAVASAAAALGLGERNDRRRRDLADIAVAALALELAATLTSQHSERRTGIDAGREQATVSAAAPLVLMLTSLLLPGRLGRAVSALGSVVLLGSGLAKRVNVLTEGDISARQPHRSLRFAQSDNLPRV